MNFVKKRGGRIIATVMAAIMLFSLFAIPGYAATSSKGTYNSDMLSQMKVREKNVAKLEKISISSNGKKLTAYLINSTTYVPIRDFYDSFINASISYSSSTRTASVNNSNFSLCATDGSYYVVANGRYLWTNTPIAILSDGRMYIPIRVLAKTLGVNVSWNSNTRSATVSGKVSYIENGKTFYNAEDLYWLSRIISAESRGEPFLGEIAVGNVILNRVRSRQYPNTIYGVIFDRKYGTQFSPVSYGTIYNTPTAQSVIAAKICLEGTSISDDILFFYNSSIATTSWIDKARPYAFTILHHRFYY